MFVLWWLAYSLSTMSSNSIQAVTYGRSSLFLSTESCWSVCLSCVQVVPAPQPQWTVRVNVGQEHAEGWEVVGAGEPESELDASDLGREPSASVTALRDPDFNSFVQMIQKWDRWLVG